MVNDIRDTNKIIPLELELSETITIDDSWGNWGVFEKYKKIIYTADCSYIVDLSTLTSSDIEMDTNNNKLQIKIPKPTIYNVNINHEKTIYEEAFTGLLRFGDLNLPSEEYGAIEREIKNSLTKKMTDSELYDKACTSSNQAIESLIKNILGNNIQLTINFK